MQQSSTQFWSDTHGVNRHTSTLAMDFRALAAVVENNLWGYSEYKIGMAAPLATSEAAALRELAAVPRMARGNGHAAARGLKSRFPGTLSL